MPANADEKIRLSVWVACLVPLVAVAGAAAYFLKGDAKPVKPAVTETVETPTSTANVEPPAPRPVPAPVASPPPARVAAAPSSAPTSVDALKEIDALLVRPPDSAGWSVEQKNAYRARLADDLGRRERSLEREVAAAHRSGDAVKEQTKTTTLEYLRKRREALEIPLTSPSGSAESPDDAGP